MTAKQIPIRVVAGITIPDTPLITEALEFARKHLEDFAYNHIYRSLLFGVIIADKIPELKDRDREAHAIAAILHDMGWDCTGELISKDRRFEVDGADAARDFLRREGLATEWDKHRLQLVWDAIALHSTGSIVFYKEPEVQACAHGIWADLVGPGGVSNGLLTWEEYHRVVTELPRLELMKGFKKIMCNLCVTKPETTYDSFVGEWGEKFVDGYMRKGVVQDMLDLGLDNM